jgi:deoxyribodipyrimidine photolyase-related protein
MIGLVFPHQCFPTLPKSWKHVVFVRHDIGYGGSNTTVQNFHIGRKVFLRAAEKAWIADQTAKGISVRVIPRGKSWYTSEPCEFWDPVDHMLSAEITKGCPNAKRLESPGFLLSRDDALQMLGASDATKHSSHAQFYAAMRNRFSVLMTKSGTPEGGKYRFDTDNRETYDPDEDIPDWSIEIAKRQSKYVKDAYTEIKSEGTSLGTAGDDIVFPTTRQGAKQALRRFLQSRLSKFGTYQDAIAENEDFLFHSVLSAPINAGLLTPDEVIDAALRWKGKVPLSSLEGFIAQILGWREFMRAVYLKFPTPPPNRLNHRNSLSTAWYTGTTGILPVDTAIHRVLENAYLHHIERLMVVGNFMCLCEIRPEHVYRWFMELFADSYDWVMIGNVYYMSQWTSDAITTKPYISSSAYILRMSDYKKGEWSEKWDTMYWNTVRRLAPLLKKNYRMAAQVAFWNKKSETVQKDIERKAIEFLRAL